MRWEFSAEQADFRWRHHRVRGPGGRRPVRPAHRHRGRRAPDRSGRDRARCRPGPAARRARRGRVGPRRGGPARRDGHAARADRPQPFGRRRRPRPSGGHRDRVRGARGGRAAGRGARRRRCARRPGADARRHRRLRRAAPPVRLPIGSFQAVKHAAAEMLVQVEAARSIIYFAAASVGAGHPGAPQHAAAAKAQVGVAVAEAADTALVLHGAIGYTWEHDLQIFYKRAKLDAELVGSPRAWNERLALCLDLVP